MLPIAGQPPPRVAGVLLTLFIATAIVACGQGENNVAAGNRDGVLHFGNGAEPRSLDPHVLTATNDIRIARALFEGLITRNPWTLEFEPGVAQRWEFSADRRVITFTLNPRARWSNGDPVTAQDFVWSFQRALDSRMGNEFAYLLSPIVNAQEFMTGEISDPNAIGVTAVDQHTVQVTLNNPTHYILDLLASHTALPVHRPSLEAHGDIYTRFTPWTRPGNIVSNGPFTLEQWQLHRQLKVVKSATYWDADKVKLNAIVFHPIESEASEEQMFRVGQLHHTERVPLNKVPAYQAMDDTPYLQEPLLGTYFFMLNTLRAPVDDVRVRRALALAIDRVMLNNTILRNSEFPSQALTPAVLTQYQPPAILNYDPEAARHLLAAAGYPGGQGWPGMELTFNTSENHRKVAVAIQQMWKDVLNIKVTLANQEWKVYLDTISEMNFQSARMGRVGSYLDPATFLEIYVTDGSSNFTGFSNDRYDEIVLRQAPQEKIPEKRLQLLHEAETILMEQVPIIPIYTYNNKHLVHASVRGLPSNILDLRNFKYVSLETTTDNRPTKD